MILFIRIFCGGAFLSMGIVRLCRHSFLLSKCTFAVLEENGTTKKYCIHSGVIWILLGVLFAFSAFSSLTEQYPVLFWGTGFAIISYAIWFKVNYN